MRVILVLLILFLLTTCSHTGNRDYRDASLGADERVSLLMKEMSLEEKVGQMCQYIGTASLENQQVQNLDEKIQYTLGLGERAAIIREGKAGSFLKVPSYREANYLQALAAESRLKIPLLIATDAIHGHGMYVPPATIYPTPIGIAASFDEELARQIAEYTAREMRATGYHWTFSPNIDVVRDARWGRFGETFGEDPLLVSRMGTAMIRGYQGEDLSAPGQVLACAKHFAAGGIAYNGLNGAETDISERSLYEIFFPPFRAAVEADVYSIMPAHNEINGIPCHANREYLTDLIRDQWGFNGMFISDWMDIERLKEVHQLVSDHKEAAEVSVNAGLDMHMHGPDFFDHVVALVKEGSIPEKRIDEAAGLILKAKFQLGLFEDPYVDSASIGEVVLSGEHLNLALEAARKSIVLLKNEENILPLEKSGTLVFVTGPLADHQAMLGDWSRPLPADLPVTPAKGIRELIMPQGSADYLHIREIRDIDKAVIAEAVRRAKLCDAAILVVGDNPIRFSPEKTIGENLDRSDLSLAGRQQELVEAIVNTGTPTIIVLINGGPIASEWIADHASAIIEAWEPGMMGGKAIAEVIFGDYNPGGRLPVTVPRSSGHVLSYYNHKPSSFHRGRFYGSDSAPLFEFGYGLSYTTFEYSDLKIADSVRIGKDVDLSFTVRNSGKYAGDEVVLVFVNDRVSSITTPVKKLVAFRRIHLKPGEKEELEFRLENKDFALLNKKLEYEVEPGDFDLLIGNDRMQKTIKMY